MSRVKKSVASRSRRKKVISLAKGYWGRNKNCFRVAKQKVQKAGQYNYRDRKVRRREFRALWILRINAAARERGLKYSEFIHLLSKNGIDINRKVLAYLASETPEAFDQIVKEITSNN